MFGLNTKILWEYYMHNKIIVLNPYIIQTSSQSVHSNSAKQVYFGLQLAP